MLIAIGGIGAMSANSNRGIGAMSANSNRGNRL